ncbi:MAG: pyridoxal-phosphate dependent enzyme, partial [Ilumatobacter sp.]
APMEQDTRTSVNVIEQLQQRRIPMVALPTPLEEAGRLPSGRRLLIKRDDLASLGMGGNKARKAEMLCADALAGGADLLVTVGAEQSNHARITAAAGARIGLETHLVVGGQGTPKPSGNQLLASLFGAHLHHAGSDSWSDLEHQMRDLVDQWSKDGRKPYSMPMGGSSPVGCSAFVLAWHELLEQITHQHREVSTVVVSSSTGGTHAGLVAGRALFGGPRVLAVDVAKASGDLAASTQRLAEVTLEFIGGRATVDSSDFWVDARHVGPGYAVPTPEADAAMVGLARSGGWLLDRVYTAKGFAGLLANDRDDTLGDGDVVFWHTGGQPAVFAEHGAPARSAEVALLTHTIPSLDLEMT